MEIVQQTTVFSNSDQMNSKEFPAIKRKSSFDASLHINDVVARLLYQSELFLKCPIFLC